jgi:hypothetical protein
MAAPTNAANVKKALANNEKPVSLNVAFAKAQPVGTRG